jgi:hypothetical protein
MVSEILSLFIVAVLAMVIVYAIYPPITYDSFINFIQKDFIQNYGYPTKQLCKMPLTTPLPQLSGPAEATLEVPRTPYHLLGDYLEPAEERLANLKSECAYVADGQTQLEVTGSYGQITNNYKKQKPDNGSTLLRELSLSFYK